MRQLFPRSYEIEEYAELPSDGRGTVFHYPGAIRDRTTGGLLIKVKPKTGQPWIGSFASGCRSAAVLTEIISCPDASEICVVSSGAAYVVRTDDPTKWQTLPCFPVTQALEIPAHNLLVFSDFTKLVAFGTEGVKWISPRLAIDELKILEVENDCLRVSAWRGGQKAEIDQVDLSTGEQIQTREVN